MRTQFLIAACLLAAVSLPAVAASPVLKSDAEALIKKIWKKEMPDAACVFVAGSMAHGAELAHSDIDLVILTADGDISRQVSDTMDGTAYELFVYSSDRLKEELWQSRRQLRGAAISMLADGVAVHDSAPLCSTLQQQAAALMEEGPPPASEQMLTVMRRILTSLADDLRDTRPLGEEIALVAALHVRLGEFYLRANNQWGGEGKQLPRLIAAVDAAYAQQFNDAFHAYNTKGDKQAVLNLVTATLQPYGGLYRGRFQQDRPRMMVPAAGAN